MPELIHRVFSYGTLRQPDVQQALYGRQVPTVADALPGYRLGWLAITDPDVIEKSGSASHPVIHRGERADAVEGSYLELSQPELTATDDYEVGDYRRIEVTLASGLNAWVYVGD
jgi:hypothetical protein